MSKQFFKSLEDAKIYEDLAFNTFESRGWLVMDVRYRPCYQRKDIDFLASRNGKQASLEIKADNRIAKTGNIYLELYTNEFTSCNGWFFYCEADFICYIDTQRLVMYCFRFADLVEYYEGFKRTRLIKHIKTEYMNEDRVALGALISLKDFSQEYPVQTIKLELGDL